MSEKEMQELDVWIAEHLFGWKRETRKMYAGEKNVKGWGRNQHLALGDGDREFTLGALIPHYSTDPAAAMEVLKKCIEGRTVGIENHGEPPTMFLLNPNNRDADGKHIAHGDTLELAICLFAKQLFSKPAGGTNE